MTFTEEIIEELCKLVDSYRDFSDGALFDQLKYNKPRKELLDRYMKILTNIASYPKIDATKEQ